MENPSGKFVSAQFTGARNADVEQFETPVNVPSSNPLGNDTRSPRTRSSSKTCKFIFPSRRKAAQQVPTSMTLLDRRKDILDDSVCPLQSLPSPKPFLVSNRMSLGTTPSPPTSSFFSTFTSPMDQQQIFSPSSSTGTFGYLRGSSVSMVLNPTTKAFHCPEEMAHSSVSESSSSEMSHTTPLSPLSRLFVPSSHPLVGESGASDNSPPISTPADAQNQPWQTSEANNSLPSDDSAQTFRPFISFNSSEESGRNSLFSISAYERDDNARTPVIGRTFRGSGPLIHSPFCQFPVGREMKFTQEKNMEAQSMADSYQVEHSLIPFGSTSSTLQKPCRPTPLDLTQTQSRINPVSKVTTEFFPDGSRYQLSASGMTETVTGSNLQADSASPNSGRNNSRTCGYLSPASPVVFSIEYVKTIQAQLWIDQEGHRTIKPVFVYRRHTPAPMARGRAGSVGYKLDGKSGNKKVRNKGKDKFWNNITPAGLVDLRMVSKDVGTFHSGKLTREAVIKRLTVNGDEGTDFLSCNASLPLGENGVYTVYGTEREKRHDKRGGSTFVWKFEYTIEDRRGPNGVIIDGDKLLRPISLICSPEMLAPSQGSPITIMYLLSKKFSLSPSATRIQPPSLPTPSPAPASAATSDISFLSDTSSFFCPVNRSSKTGNTVKVVSRPTTTATDIRLQSASESRLGKRQSTASGVPSTIFKATKENMLARGIVSLQVPSLPSAKEKRPSVGSPNRAKQSSLLQSKIPMHEDALSSSYFTPIKRPHTSKSSPRRPRTAGSRLEKSMKHMGEILFGRPSPQPSASPCGATIKNPNESLVLGFVESRDLTSRQGHGDLIRPVEGWRTPTEEEIKASLAAVSTIIKREHHHLELLARHHRLEDNTVERLDSTGEPPLVGDVDDLQPPFSIRNTPYYLTRRHIASPRALNVWMTLPIGNVKRPSTAHGGKPSTRTSRWSERVAVPKRPGTADDVCTRIFPPSSLFGSGISYFNSSTNSLGLPLPPRKLRSPTY